ncbi:uncharacterized protein LOC119665763 [Teleopsis dalmanni]|uniref:uncharacterized protein LOC119665762 n=1 Tax=Teleopsis dalmanni TaxID=139649 RepID=UPI0018CCE204|nr:uncharacterized protein LOC119665762 [Teleopsis dalmanni]XP_037930935.1 uncharacterized protein LOC119665763 [Teleopsis dalmanni]
MFRQILVDSRDRCFQYILWRASESEEIHTYQLNTVTYGTASAPFLAVRSLHYLADEYAFEFPIGSKSSFYIDDFLCGANSLDELSAIKYEVFSILRNGCMEVAKWHSKIETFVDDITIKDLNLTDTSITNALGIMWDQTQDQFLFSFSPKDLHKGNLTKRSILSLASSLFDPLGLLAPLLIIAKIILKELWLLKLNWDETIPQNLYTAWENFLKQLYSLSSIVIPRFCLGVNSQVIQLLGFCDSSLKASNTKHCCKFAMCKISRSSYEEKVVAET